MKQFSSVQNTLFVPQGAVQGKATLYVTGNINTYSQCTDAFNPAYKVHIQTAGPLNNQINPTTILL